MPEAGMAQRNKGREQSGFDWSVNRPDNPPVKRVDNNLERFSSLGAAPIGIMLAGDMQSAP